MKSIRNNIGAQFNKKKRVKHLVNFEERGSVNNGVSNWEVFILGLK